MVLIEYSNTLLRAEDTAQLVIPPCMSLISMSVIPGHTMWVEYLQPFPKPRKSKLHNVPIKKNYLNLQPYSKEMKVQPMVTVRC